MMLRNKTACFTGHRQLSSEDISIIEATLFSTIENLYMEGYEHFIAGGALGFDTLAAEAVLMLKSIYPDIKLTIAIPCPEQSDSWNYGAKRKYREILSLADSKVLISDYYFRGCMQVRNKYMVDNSSALVAFYKNTPGGTGNTYKYALKKLPYIINLADELNEIR